VESEDEEPERDLSELELELPEPLKLPEPLVLPVELPLDASGLLLLEESVADELLGFWLFVLELRLESVVDDGALVELGVEELAE